MPRGASLMLSANRTRVVPTRPRRRQRPHLASQSRTRGSRRRWAPRVRLLPGIDQRVRWRAQESVQGGLGPAHEVDVLVVDDEENVRKSICDILNIAGMTTAEANDGEAALRMLDESRAGVMVLDIRMPRLDGIATLGRLERPPPTVIVSAHEVGDEVREELGNKVFLYLQKPFPPHELLSAVASALGREQP